MTKTNRYLGVSTQSAAQLEADARQRDRDMLAARRSSVASCTDPAIKLDILRQIAELEDAGVVVNRWNRTECPGDIGTMSHLKGGL